MKSEIIYTELGEKSNAQIEFQIAYNCKLYLSTYLDLSGRGIKQIGYGETNLKGKKTYIATEKAFELLKQKYSTAFMANL